MIEAVRPGRVARELAILGVIFGLFWALFALWIHPWIGWQSAAPMPLRTIALVLAIRIFMVTTGERWADFGVARPERLWTVPLLAFVFLVAKILLVQPLADRLVALFELPTTRLDVFANLHGNALALGVWLLVAWLVAGFGEEFVFRGYLMKRLANLFGGGTSGWAGALLGQALLFGLGHFYLGPAGIVSTALGAAFIGACFLASGRNLWPVVVLHGAWDSLGLVLIYLNGTPSTG